jgi:hypothetical protein
VDTVETEEVHPDPPGRMHLSICAIAGVTGIALIVLATVLGGLWGPIRLIFVLAGSVLVILAVLQALGVTKLRIGASSDGGIVASAERPIGYTKTITKSDSLVEGSIPAKTGDPFPKKGIMPPKEGTMPAMNVEDATPALPIRPADGGTAPGHPTSSAEP